MTVRKANDVLGIGEFEPTLEDQLVARYEIARLPDGPGRAEFLAEHGADIRVVVTSGPPASTPTPSRRCPTWRRSSTTGPEWIQSIWRRRSAAASA